MLDLGKDHYHLQGDALTALGDKVRHGNMEDVLKVYEEEMKVRPIYALYIATLTLAYSLR